MYVPLDVRLMPCTGHVSDSDRQVDVALMVSAHSLWFLPQVEMNQAEQAEHWDGEFQNVCEQCSPDQKTHQFGVGLPRTQTIKYQMSFPDGANRCRMFFPNCNKHTKLCAYWNTQPHWGELDRHLIAWPDKGKHSQRKHYTPEKEKIIRSLVKEMTKIQVQQHVSVSRNLYTLPRPALDPVGRNGTHAASIWFVGCLGW